MATIIAVKREFRTISTKIHLMKIRPGRLNWVPGDSPAGYSPSMTATCFEDSKSDGVLIGGLPAKRLISGCVR